jgi:hypothetical protein
MGLGEKNTHLNGMRSNLRDEKKLKIKCYYSNYPKAQYQLREDRRRSRGALQSLFGSTVRCHEEHGNPLESQS